MPATMDLQSKGTALNKCYIEDRHQVGVAVCALMLHRKVGYEEFLESLVVPELTLSFRSYF